MCAQGWADVRRPVLIGPDLTHVSSLINVVFLCVFFSSFEREMFVVFFSCVFKGYFFSKLILEVKTVCSVFPQLFRMGQL